MTTDPSTPKAANCPKRKALVNAKPVPAQPSATTKLAPLATPLALHNRASIAEMMSATGWHTHSVRGALAGSLQRRGWVLIPEKSDGVRRYRSGGEQ